MAYNPNPYADLVPQAHFLRPAVAPAVRRALFFDPAPVDHGEDGYPWPPVQQRPYWDLPAAGRAAADAWLEQD